MSLFYVLLFHILSRHYIVYYITLHIIFAIRLYVYISFFSNMLSYGILVYVGLLCSKILHIGAFV